MNIKKWIVIVVLVVFNPTPSNSQSNTGKVIYRASINTDSYVEGIKKDKRIKEDIKKLKMSNASRSIPMNFFLFFNGNESLYHAEYDLNEQRDMQIGWNQTGVVAGDDYISYVNIATKENLKQNFFLDKLLISVVPLEWVLTQETKKIGDYICFKATSILKEEREEGGCYSEPITAWYTPEIPVTFGIQNFTGLPGLTLELFIETKYGELQYKATSIELNVKKIKIKKPKGKVITHKKYIELISGFRN